MNINELLFPFFMSHLKSYDNEITNKNYKKCSRHSRISIVSYLQIRRLIFNSLAYHSLHQLYSTVVDQIHSFYFF